MVFKLLIAKAVGVVPLAIFFILTFLYSEWLDLTKIEEKVGDRLKAERILRLRKMVLSLIYVIGLVLITVTD